MLEKEVLKIVFHRILKGSLVFSKMTDRLSKEEFVRYLFSVSRINGNHSPEYKEAMSILDSAAYELYLFSRNIRDISNAVKDCYQTANKQGNDSIVKICRKHPRFA